MEYLLCHPPGTFSSVVSDVTEKCVAECHSTLCKSCDSQHGREACMPACSSVENSSVVRHYRTCLLFLNPDHVCSKGRLEELGQRNWHLEGDLAHPVVPWRDLDGWVLHA
eukprot:29717-Chlamydomonas_euryale.AAC.7